MLRELDRATWLASDTAAGLASAGHSREQVDWALSIVHSRSFGAPGKAGAVAVRPGRLRPCRR